MQAPGIDAAGKPVDKNDNVVITFFANDAAAQEAIDGLKVWDKSNDHMKLGAIGVISKDGDHRPVGAVSPLRVEQVLNGRQLERRARP